MKSSIAIVAASLTLTGAAGAPDLTYLHQQTGYDSQSQPYGRYGYPQYKPTYGYPKPSPYGQAPHHGGYEQKHGYESRYKKSCCLDYRLLADSQPGYNLSGVTLFDNQHQCPSYQITDKDLCQAAGYKFSLDMTGLTASPSTYASIASGSPAIFTAKKNADLAITDDGNSCYNLYPDVKAGERLQTACSPDNQFLKGALDILSNAAVLTSGSYYGSNDIETKSSVLPFIVGNSYRTSDALDVLGEIENEDFPFYVGQDVFAGIANSIDLSGLPPVLGYGVTTDRFTIDPVNLTEEKTLKYSNDITAAVCAASQGLLRLPIDDTIEITPNFNSMDNVSTFAIDVVCSTPECVFDIDPINAGFRDFVIWTIEVTSDVKLIVFNLSDVQVEGEWTQIFPVAVSDQLQIIYNAPNATTINVALTNNEFYASVIAPIASSITLSQLEVTDNIIFGSILSGNEEGLISVYGGHKIEATKDGTFADLPLSDSIRLTYCTCLCKEENHSYDH